VGGEEGRIRNTLSALAFTLVVTVGAAHAQTVQQPFSLAISVAHDTVKTGTPIVINIMFKNISDHDINRAIRPEGRTHGELLGFPPIVRDAEGKEPPLTKLGRLIFGRPAPGDGMTVYEGISSGNGPLHPGKAITPEIRLSELYDLSVPGQYTVLVWHYDVEKKEAVKSNTVTVTVTPD
jgi:hypothetical protein